MILSISASQVARITGMNHWCLAPVDILNIKLYLSVSYLELLQVEYPYLKCSGPDFGIFAKTTG
jgi:hypothetical protein